MPRDIAVHQVMATLGYGDAIGNEALGIQRILQAAGYDSRIYVETAEERVEHLTDDYRDLPGRSRPDDLLIHHFSIGSKASRVAFALPERMVLIYHNITPPSYFVGVNETLVVQCWNGRRELRGYTHRCDLALGDSEYNRLELEAIGFARTGVLPVVPSFAHLDVTPNRMLAADFDDDRTNILFVGRMIPNKRIDNLIRIFQAYRLKYDRRARLLLVGSHGGFEGYVASLYDLITKLRVPDVHLIGHVSNEELTALYDIGDIFLSASAHEGFCVPLIEAFYKGLPVVAFRSTAVPDTMDGAGVLYECDDPRHVASLIHTLATDQAWYDEVIRGQDEALGRLRDKDFEQRLLDVVDEVRGLPRAPAVPVVPDFWEQVERTDALEELRQRRPLAYAALPKRPKSPRRD
jgi:glycosyltransferase involved in cell wall biosynthesis